MGNCLGLGKKMDNSPRLQPGDIPPHLKVFTFNELKCATRNFHAEGFLGEGGFGRVYEGWIHEQTLVPTRPGAGMRVAVKRLKPDGFQGHKQWMCEVKYLGHFRHANLVKLIGYCSEGKQRLLVYEYMPRGSLEVHLFNREIQTTLSWKLRIKIAIGAARGLALLHESEQPLIYRDFKAANILLDWEYNAKIADFGLARAGPTGDRTHVSTQVMGTQGYAAPEYIATGRLTTKCDVYSFGVVLLELLTGRSVIDTTKFGQERYLVEWARSLGHIRRRTLEIMDARLAGQYRRRAAYGAILLAYRCTSEAELRPSMSEVLDVLEQISAISCPSSPCASAPSNVLGTGPRSPLRVSNYSSPGLGIKSSPLC